MTTGKLCEAAGTLKRLTVPCRYTELFKKLKELKILILHEDGTVSHDIKETHRICSFDEADINLHKMLVKLALRKVGSVTSHPPAKAGQKTDPSKTTLVAGSKGNGCPLPPLLIFSKATFDDSIANNLPVLRDNTGRRTVKARAYGNDSGGMTRELFKEWLAIIISEYTQEDLEKGIVILCDGVATHILPELACMHDEWKAKGWNSCGSRTQPRTRKARTLSHLACSREGTEVALSARLFRNTSQHTRTLVWTARQ